MATVKIPVWRETDTHRNWVPFIIQAVDGGGSGMGDTVFNQVTLLASPFDNIPIVVNGGSLPATDDKIMVNAPAGSVPNSPSNGWQADRVSMPNRILLTGDYIQIESVPFGVQIAIPVV